MKHQAIYARLKTFLAETSNVSRDKLKARSELRKHPLFYDEQGVRALAGKLNRLFRVPPLKRPLTPADTARAKTIRDIYKLIKKGYE